MKIRRRLAQALITHLKVKLLARRVQLDMRAPRVKRSPPSALSDRKSSQMRA